MATTGSMGILGFSEIGRLAAGYKADIVFLDLEPYHLRAAARTASAGGVCGKRRRRRQCHDRRKIRAAGGQALTIDEKKLRRDVKAAVERLDGANAAGLSFARGIADFVGAFCIGQAHAPYHIHRRLDERAYLVRRI